MNTFERKIHKLDATDQAYGRLASQIAIILRGKNKPEYQPHLDEGDIVEVVNITKMSFSGKKLLQKKYFSFTGFVGGLKTRRMSDVFAKDPGEVLRRAVKQMLPPTKLRDAQLKRLIIR
ncbi:50S ribosomal protein L13 [Candidatus Falkowbacteria bacterium HGW-Falkowbacteria-2]|uniref:Large ribosomal subunit protein uL13 n=1 Tax=Candidatus Falkowbacteria bacterium HGW-Falkowbacteria-2 TaxID=2013769 RepID=A0A2N2E0A3_9BACT|nr:MAG: 50S ribosomal protein L13 [Candidatus Falkowbacteria bacterium HGW-Falkowbacteria-2]